ncbi:carboxypeptidase-like regulatory domain-containing protein [Pedobacter sp. KR3-3]|uniref:Carboxypeptidase-like regulatory domain-containing protein n=1 Tax=Pedobacter albus TaxID=3113905 RepID=A0ABU7I9M8_9SPHI|nr:carboxypeptidase-like regulatory domain-containing protein [Pedobacter sp. KR3-3]MEE1946184.1 carboxypeptidase-like regulatory domain-containing protein [Pedobacter sp. KR3-3]
MSYNEWIDIEVLEDYLDGKLDAKMMHQVEKLSLEDPFVAEALAGLSQSPKRAQSLSLLQKQLQERIAQKPIEQKRWRLTSQRLSIAAAAAVLFVVASLLFWMRESNNREQLAKQQPKQVEVNAAPQVADNKAEKPVAPVADVAVATEIDKALATVKTNSLAKLNAKEKAIAKANAADMLAKKTVAEASDRSEASVAAAAPAPVAMQARVLKVDSLSNVAVAKREARPLNQTLSGRAPGITFAPDIFSGKVISKIDGLPIPGADVKVLNTNIRTLTNSKGEFSLRLDSSNSQSLTVNYLGFNAKEVSTKANKAIIELEPSDKALQEVAVVVGKAKIEAPTPVDSWAKYREYLNNNNKLYKGTVANRNVLLSFEVDTKGRPSNIKVVKGLTKAEDDEAIRLVKEGPNWVRHHPSDSKVELSIEF